jgi:hypothetical protein
MVKFVLTLALGAAIGYAVGFGDAQKHEQHIVRRVVERIGGSSRDRVKTDIDGRMADLERR